MVAEPPLKTSRPEIPRYGHFTDHKVSEQIWEDATGLPLFDFRKLGYYVPFAITSFHKAGYSNKKR